MAKQEMTLSDWFDDLCVRFILNLPVEERSSLERICFQIEEAQWYYEDFIRPLNPSLPSMNLKPFSQKFFQHIFSGAGKEHYLNAFSRFVEYKTRVPVRGAILLNKDMDQIVLVKGWKKGSRWSFPRGKINKDEKDLDCAVREVFEETGLDLSKTDLLEDENDMKRITVHMREQEIMVFVVRGVSMDTVFEPQTRKEISDIAWYRVTDLPTAKGARINPAKTSMFYMVAPFISPLLKWIDSQHKADQTKAAEASPAGKPGAQSVADRSAELRKLLSIGLPPPTRQVEPQSLVPSWILSSTSSSAFPSIPTNVSAPMMPTHPTVPIHQLGQTHPGAQVQRQHTMPLVQPNQMMPPMLPARPGPSIHSIGQPPSVQQIQGILPLPTHPAQWFASQPPISRPEARMPIAEQPKPNPTFQFVPTQAQYNRAVSKSSPVENVLRADGPAVQPAMQALPDLSAESSKQLSKHSQNLLSIFMTPSPRPATSVPVQTVPAPLPVSCHPAVSLMSNSMPIGVSCAPATTIDVLKNSRHGSPPTSAFVSPAESVVPGLGQTIPKMTSPSGKTGQSAQIQNRAVSSSAQIPGQQGPDRRGGRRGGRGNGAASQDPSRRPAEFRPNPQKPITILSRPKPAVDESTAGGLSSSNTTQLTPVGSKAPSPTLSRAKSSYDITSPTKSQGQSTGTRRSRGRNWKEGSGAGQDNDSARNSPTKSRPRHRSRSRRRTTAGRPELEGVFGQPATGAVGRAGPGGPTASPSTEESNKNFFLGFLASLKM